MSSQPALLHKTSHITCEPFPTILLTYKIRKVWGDAACTHLSFPLLRSDLSIGCAAVEVDRSHCYEHNNGLAKGGVSKMTHTLLR
jgi:hypothetical protein